MLFNKYVLAVTIFLITIVSVSASPQLGGIGQSGSFNGISLNDITPTKITLETEGKWFIEKKTISPVKIKLKQVEVNKIKNKVPAKIVERVGSKEILTGNVIKEIDSTKLTTSKCSSVETDVYKKALFDCSEGILYDDDKETTLITSIGKEHSSLEAEFSLEGKDYNNLFLKIDQTFEFPHQQKTRVFVKVDDVWKPVCNNVASGNHCNLGSIARNKDNLEVRLENYAREGASTKLVFLVLL